MSRRQIYITLGILTGVLVIIVSGLSWLVLTQDPNQRESQTQSSSSQTTQSSSSKPVFTEEAPTYTDPDTALRWLETATNTEEFEISCSYQDSDKTGYPRGNIYASFHKIHITTDTNDDNVGHILARENQMWVWRDNSENGSKYELSSRSLAGNWFEGVSNNKSFQASAKINRERLQCNKTSVDTSNFQPPVNSINFTVRDSTATSSEASTTSSSSSVSSLYSVKTQDEYAEYYAPSSSSDFADTDLGVSSEFLNKIKGTHKCTYGSGDNSDKIYLKNGKLRVINQTRTSGVRSHTLIKDGQKWYWFEAEGEANGTKNSFSQKKLERRWVSEVQSALTASVGIASLEEKLDCQKTSVSDDKFKVPDIKFIGETQLGEVGQDN